MKRSTVPAPSVCCDGCPNLLVESEARVSRRAYAGEVLCWRCRIHYGTRATVHQAPPGCFVLVTGTGYGIWIVTLTVPDGREFQGSAWTDHQALSSARAKARAAGLPL